MRILILSRSSALYSTQSLIKACLRRGHSPEVVDHILCDLMIKDQQPLVYYQGRSLEGFDAVIPRVGSSVTTFGAHVMRHFEAMGVFTVTKAQSMLMARNKWRCYQVLVAAGIPVPDSLLPNCHLPDDYLIQRHFQVPMIIKQLESTHGMGVILAETYQTSSSLVESFNRMRESMIVQQYVKEAGGADLRVFVVDGRVVAAMKRQARAGEFRSNLHRGATAERVNIAPEEEEMALRVSHVMDLPVAGIDLLRSSHGPLVLEVNTSPGLEGIETATGVDVADNIIRYAERGVAACMQSTQLLK